MILFLNILLRYGWKEKDKHNNNFLKYIFKYFLETFGNEMKYKNTVGEKIIIKIFKKYIRNILFSWKNHKTIWK